MSAIQEQAAYLCTVAPQHANAARSEAARLIASHTPGDLDKVFFTNGGADANEHAIRMARLHTGRIKVLSTYRSYHGGTHLAVNVTGDPRRWANDHGAAGTVHFFGPFLYRSAFHATTEAEECERALQHLADMIALEGPQTIAAIMLEAIPGTAGIMIPPPGLPLRRPPPVRRARHRADRRRGDVGLRPGRSLVRLRARRPGARPADLRQGRELRLRPARRRGHQPRDRRDLRRPRVPRRPDVLGPPAGLRRRRRHHPHDGGRPRRRARRRARARRSSAPAWPSSRASTSGSARSEVRARSGPSSSSPTARRASRSRRTAAPAPP